MSMLAYWLILRISAQKYQIMIKNGPDQHLETCILIEIQAISIPVQLFPPVCLLALRKCSSPYVYSILYDYQVPKSKHEIVKKFENGAKIFYQVTPANGPGDMVSARDWFMISKAGMRGNVWFQGGCSVEYPEGPKGDMDYLITLSFSYCAQI